MASAWARSAATVTDLFSSSYSDVNVLFASGSNRCENFSGSWIGVGFRGTIEMEESETHLGCKHCNEERSDQVGV